MQPLVGVKPGVPDLLMPVVSGPDCGLALEFKSAVGRMSPEQGESADHLKLNGWLVLMVRSADAARATVMHYLDVELPPLCLSTTPSLRPSTTARHRSQACTSWAVFPDVKRLRAGLKINAHARWVIG